MKLWVGIEQATVYPNCRCLLLAVDTSTALLHQTYVENWNTSTGEKRKLQEEDYHPNVTLHPSPNDSTEVIFLSLLRKLINTVSLFAGPSRCGFALILINLSIIAAHGLDENGTNAWIDLETGCFWLRDLLPCDIFEARVLVLDYKADAMSFFRSSSSDRILHYVQTLLEELNAEKEFDNCKQRPIIFLCHGLGGIIVENGTCAFRGRHLCQTDTSAFHRHIDIRPDILWKHESFLRE